jgi:hypothetical protein
MIHREKNAEEQLLDMLKEQGWEVLETAPGNYKYHLSKNNDSLLAVIHPTEFPGEVFMIGHYQLTANDLSILASLATYAKVECQKKEANGSGGSLERT